MQKDLGNEDVTVQEFIFSYIVLEEKIRLKKINIKHHVDELNFRLAKFNERLNENTHEKLTSQGIAKDSSLNVTLLDGKDLGTSQSGQIDPFVVLELGSARQLSKSQFNTSEPIWNEDFSL